MGAYALVGVKLGDYTAQCGIFEVDKFIVLDLMNLSKIEVVYIQMWLLRVDTVSLMALCKIA